MLNDFDPQAVGVNYDIGHAASEDGFGGWINGLRITGPHFARSCGRGFPMGER